MLCVRICVLLQRADTNGFAIAKVCVRVCMCVPCMCLAHACVRLHVCISINLGKKQSRRSVGWPHQPTETVRDRLKRATREDPAANYQLKSANTEFPL